MGEWVNVYVDAFNLYYGSLRGTPYRWLDLEALSKNYLRKGDVLNRIRYFTAKVTARPNDPRAPQRQQIYLRALETIPCLTIHYGRFQETQPWMMFADRPAGCPAGAKVIKTEEKGSDVNLATHLLCDAVKKDCQLAIVVSNDSDLCEPIRIVQEQFGLRVGVLNPHQYASLDLLRIPPTFLKRVRPGALKRSQFPDEMEDSRGTLRKPMEWRVTGP